MTVEIKYFLLFVLYLAAHLAVYALFLRRRALFRREAAILLTHVVSFIAAGAALAAAAIAAGVAHPLELIAAGLSIHGIYSLSFLELWSLAEGGYSLSVLAHIREGGTAPDPGSHAEMAAIGARKREARLAALVRAGLVRGADGAYRLTGRGRLVAAVFRAFEWATTGGEADRFSR